MIRRLRCTNGSKLACLLLLSLFISSLANAQQKILSEKENAAVLLKKSIGASSINQPISKEYRITDAYQDQASGLFLVYTQQMYQGIPVYNRISMYAFKNDSLVYNKQDIIKTMQNNTVSRSSSYSISPEQAIQFAARHLSISVSQQLQVLQIDEQQKHFVYKIAHLSADSSSADLIWLPINNDKEIKLAWNVNIPSPNMSDNWLVRVDAQTGAFIEKNNLVLHERATDECGAILPVVKPTGLSANKLTAAQKANNNLFAPPAVTRASYNVFAFPLASANYGTRSVEINPWEKAGTGNNATSLGWHFDGTTNFTTTQGNNVRAINAVIGKILDDDSNMRDTSTTTIPALTFNNAIDPAVNPALSSNLRAGIDNMFYWCNIVHDVSYQYGFDEASGNFQLNNQGRGGKGGDPVYALAEYGASLNNSQFIAGRDGSQGTMLMYINKSDWWGATLHINNDVPVATNYSAFEAFSNLQSQLGLTGPKTGKVIRVNDDGATTNYGCGTISNASDIKSNIAIIDMGGGCRFQDKISNAQNAGAIAVILVNDLPGTPPGTYLFDEDLMHFRTDLKIPCVYVTSVDGATLINNLAGLNVTLATTSLFRDGALENEFVVHEYTHGISQRLTGAPSTNSCLGNQENGSEGWSDYVALMLTTNWATAQMTDGAKPRPLGTYTRFQTADGPGTRTFPYSTDRSIDPWSYGDMATATGGEIHAIGEIWCTALWDMTWAIIEKEGIDPDIYNAKGNKGNTIALQLVIEGLKLQPCDPGFIDSRNAILKADSLLYGGRHTCIIWHAFAVRGMGYGASQGNRYNYQDQIPAFGLPPLKISVTANKDKLVSGDIVTYTIKGVCPCEAQSNITIVDTLSPYLTYLSSTGGVYNNPQIRFSGLNFAAGETKTISFQASVNNGEKPARTVLNDSGNPGDYNKWDFVAYGNANCKWVRSVARSHSPSSSWFVSTNVNSGEFSGAWMSSGDLVLDYATTLSFWHYFDLSSDPGSGGSVQISTNGGVQWIDLGPKMIQNPYSIIPGHVGPPGFLGKSGGFVQTIVSLADYVGKTVRIKFEVSCSANAEGWYVDDIVVNNQAAFLNTAYAYARIELLDSSSVFKLFSESALPLHFISFDAQKQNKSAALHWKVSNEINIDKYIVQRSTDGLNFSAIGEVFYNNTPGNEKDYYFTDNQPLPGNNYYRIAEKDLDGKLNLTDIKLLQFIGDNNSVRLLPVPTHNHSVQLQIETANNGSYTAYLLNTVGQVIKTYTVRTGTNNLDLQNFTSGIYYIKIELGSAGTVLKKLLIE